MSPEQLRSSRATAGWTQEQAASRLGVSQAYLALLENGKRRITPALRSRVIKLFRLGPTSLSLDIDSIISWNSATLAAAIANLGYPGFRRLGGKCKANPAVVLLGAISAADVEVRVIEALPWLVLEYSDLDWDWLIREAKLRDAQNRLGFLLALARQLAESQGKENTRDRLHRVEETLERSRLVREDSLCQANLTPAERRWLRKRRTPVARHWNLLTDIDSRSLPYAA